MDHVSVHPAVGEQSPSRQKLHHRPQSLCLRMPHLTQLRILSLPLIFLLLLLPYFTSSLLGDEHDPPGLLHDLLADHDLVLANLLGPNRIGHHRLLQMDETLKGLCNEEVQDNREGPRRCA